MTNIEIWRDIPGYEEIYQISDMGRVKSLWFNREKILKTAKDKNGYLLGCLWKDGKQRTKRIHRLVMLAFVGESDLHVNHKNGDKSDNRLNNLEYCSHAYNMKHAAQNGLTAKGEKAGMFKLTEGCVRNIKYGHKGMTQREIAKIYKIRQQHVSKIRKGEIWRHV